MKDIKKSQDEYINIFRNIFKQTIKKYHLSSGPYDNKKTSIKDKMYQNGFVNEEYSLVNAILNRKNKQRRNIALIGCEGSDKTFYLIEMCDVLLEMGFFALYVPCCDFVFAEYSFRNYFSYLLHDRNNLFETFYLSFIKQFNQLIILFDGYDEISEYDRKIFNERVSDLEKKDVQLVISTRETFELDEEKSFDNIYKQDFSKYQILSKNSGYYQGESEANFELGFMRNQMNDWDNKNDVSRVQYRGLVSKLKKLFLAICKEDNKILETPEHLLGMIGIYLLDSKKNYIDYCEFRNISCYFSDWQNKKVYGTIKATLLKFEVIFPILNNNIIFFHQQLCNEVVKRYLLICLKKRNIDCEVISKVFSEDIINYIVQEVKEEELIELFIFKDINYIVNIPCYWFDVLKHRYNFQLQQFVFNNIDFSNSNFSGCRFADSKQKANFYNCRISNATLVKVVKKGIVNAVSHLSYSNLFATALSDKTVRIWNLDEGCIQILENLETTILKLISCKKYLIGIGIDRRMYVWKRKEKCLEKRYKVLYSVSDILFNRECSKAIILQDECKLVEPRKKIVIYKSCEKIRILSYIWNLDDYLLVTTFNDFLWIDLKKKRAELIPNKFHLSVICLFKYSSKEEMLLGYDFNRILIMKKNRRGDFEIYRSYMSKYIIINAFYSKKLNEIIVICKNGKIILLDLYLNYIGSFWEIKKRITASEINDDWIYLATNEGFINVLYIDSDGYIRNFKEYKPLFDLNILGCKFENVQFQDDITETIKDNGGIIKNI